MGRRGFPSWKAWLTKAGAKQQTQTRGMQINNSATVLQTAIDGHGIALARSVMARDNLSGGRLVRLYPSINVTSSLAYYQVYRPECSSLPRLQVVRNWLHKEVNT